MKLLRLAPLALLCSSAPIQESGFLPALDSAQRSAGQWLAAFEASGGRDRDALWALYYSYPAAGAPAETIEELRAWIAATRDDSVRRDLETILAQWQVEYEPAPLEPENGPAEGSFTLQEALALLPGGPEAWYVLPEADEAASEASLRLALDSEDSRARCDAAFELARRGLALPLVLERLVLDLHAYPTPPEARDHFMLMHIGAKSRTAVPIAGAPRAALAAVLDAGGAEASQLLIEMAADARSDPELRREAWRLLVSAGSDEWLDSFAHLELPGDEVVEELRAGFARALECRLHLPTRDHVARGWRVHELGSDATARALLAELQRRLDAGPPAPELAELAGRLGAASGAARESLRARLRAVLAEGSPAEEAALFWLAQWGEDEPALRAAYVRAIQRLDDVADEAPTSLPLLACHDAETVTALRALFERSSAPTAFVQALARAELLDADAEPMAARLVAALAPDDVGAWRQAFAAGLRGRLEADSRVPALAQAYQLGASVRAKRAAGESIAAERALLLALLDGSGESERTPGVLGVVTALGLVDEDLADWCLDELLSEPFFGERSLAMLDALATVELTRAQKARLYRLPLEGEVDGELLEFLARQGPDVVELAGALRRRVEAGDLAALEAVLSIARPAPRDLAALRDAMEGGGPAERARARAIAARHELELRAAR